MLEQEISRLLDGAEMSADGKWNVVADVGINASENQYTLKQIKVKLGTSSRQVWSGRSEGQMQFEHLWQKNPKGQCTFQSGKTHLVPMRFEVTTDGMTFKATLNNIGNFGGYKIICPALPPSRGPGIGTAESESTAGEWNWTDPMEELGLQLETVVSEKIANQIIKSDKKLTLTLTCPVPKAQ